MNLERVKERIKEAVPTINRRAKIPGTEISYGNFFNFLHYAVPVGGALGVGLLVAWLGLDAVPTEQLRWGKEAELSAVPASGDTVCGLMVPGDKKQKAQRKELEREYYGWWKRKTFHPGLRDKNKEIIRSDSVILDPLYGLRDVCNRRGFPNFQCSAITDPSQWDSSLYIHTHTVNIYFSPEQNGFQPVQRVLSPEEFSNLSPVGVICAQFQE